ncbi:MAG: electron transfer flavoprotein subunit beta/FixA family protein [Nitrososphaerota archaeon]|nr:electron transfer flavoprotein subunit beta/FixA family protein [Nitrososphaerota archaeon]
MNLIVCLKVTPKIEQIKFDEQKKTIVREGVENEINDADKNALEAALKLRDSSGGKVVVLSMGPPSFEPFLRLAVAMGADDAVLLSDRVFGGADTYATSRVLAAGIEKLKPYDAVFCGEASSDGSTEQVPPSIAGWLGIPHVSYVSELGLSGDRVRAKREVTDGHEVVEVKPPVLVSVQLGCNSPRFPDFRRKRWAEKEFKLRVLTNQDLGFKAGDVGLEGSRTEVTGLSRMRSPERKRELVKGTEEEVAKRLVQIIRG